jgi:hypothetical protein
MKRHSTKHETEAIRLMIHQRLRSNTEVKGLEDHPDEDTICAFIEGRLEEAGSSQMVSHLIACGSCRRITSQATRLDSQINSEYNAPLQKAEPGRLRSILEGLGARVLPVAEEDVVFAYQNPPGQDDAMTETPEEEAKSDSARDVKETESN